MAASAALPGCRGRREDPFLVYFNPEHALTLRYPSSWKTEQAQQDGVWYRYFLAPPEGPERMSPVSATLIAGPIGVGVDQYAQTWLAGNTLLSSRDESRQGARGKYYVFASADGRTRHSLLLLEESAASRAALPAPAAPAPARAAASPAAGTAVVTMGPPRTRPSPAAAPSAEPEPEPEPPSAWVYGLYAQGEATAFEAQQPVVEEMARSLTLERPAGYPEERNEKFAFALRVPPSWRSTRTFSSGGTYLEQFTSPPLGVDRQQTVHASLTLTVEPAPGDGSVEAYYKATRDKLGEAFVVLSHTPWRDGFVDVLHSETPVAVSRAKRFFLTEGGRGYSLALEARDDVYPRASRWCDMIAATLRVGPEAAAP